MFEKIKIVGDRGKTFGKVVECEVYRRHEKGVTVRWPDGKLALFNGFSVTRMNGAKFTTLMTNCYEEVIE